MGSVSRVKTIIEKNSDYISLFHCGTSSIRTRSYYLLRVYVPGTVRSYEYCTLVDFQILFDC